ncbi:MAG: chemotaxis protein CheW, partial [Gammaproteobacteria bacterium]|nr:chemotaxis protein CheW [Gammaproteobacteria bacterium]
QATEPTIDTCIVIVEVRIDGQSTVLGALADSVQEVIEFRRDQLEPAPRLGTRVDTDFIRAMGKHDDNFVIILDMNRVFSTDQLTDIQDGGHVPVDEMNKPIADGRDAVTG